LAIKTINSNGPDVQELGTWPGEKWLIRYQRNPTNWGDQKTMNLTFLGVCVSGVLVWGNTNLHCWLWQYFTYNGSLSGHLCGKLRSLSRGRRIVPDISSGNKLKRLWYSNGVVFLLTVSYWYRYEENQQFFENFLILLQICWDCLAHSTPISWVFWQCRLNLTFYFGKNFKKLCSDG
jgi:hypothetical protein